jgi:hypothetical protein
MSGSKDVILFHIIRDRLSSVVNSGGYDEKWVGGDRAVIVLVNKTSGH